jgi:hypothetical protein
MADDHNDPDTPPDDPTAPPKLLAGAGCLIGGFILAGLLGMGLAFAAFQANAPGWAVPAAFFAPPVLYVLVITIFFLPGFMRKLREEARNAPSPESVAAVGTGVEARRVSLSLADPDAPPTTADDTPTVPHAITSPGKTLAYRLERTGMPLGCQLGCALFAAIFWNAIVGVFVYQVVEKWNRGVVVQWFEVLFLVPFVLVGVVLILGVVATAIKWLLSLLVGTVEVELSAHPLAPGAKAQLHVAQVGLLPLGRVTVVLVCAEEASYVAGTTKSTARKEVVNATVSDPQQSPEGGAVPLTAEFRVPVDAMHSFDALNNKITWTVRVTGRVLGLFSYSEDFGVTVAPG